MSIARKSILVAGLGRFVPAGQFPSGQNVQRAEEDMKRASERGFDCTEIHLNPKDLTNTLDMVKETLRSKHWDGFVIGYGVRGMKEYTELFEGAVNASREITPGTKFMFSTAPDGIVEAIERVFPQK